MRIERYDYRIGASARAVENIYFQEKFIFLGCTVPIFLGDLNVPPPRPVLATSVFFWGSNGLWWPWIPPVGQSFSSLSQLLFFGILSFLAPNRRRTASWDSGGLVQRDLRTRMAARFWRVTHEVLGGWSANLTLGLLHVCP